MTPRSARHALLRVLGGDVPQVLQLRVAVDRVVVDAHLGVERDHPPVLGQHERVDLHEHRVEAHERLVERAEDLRPRRRRPPRRCRPGRRASGASWGWKPDEGVDVPAGERLGLGAGDLLDVHAAHRRQHRQRLLGGAVERDRGVVLAGRSPRPPRSTAAAPCGPGCPFPGCRPPGPGLVGRVGELDPAGLAAAADLDLRLHHDPPADLLGGRAGLLGGRRHLAPRGPGCRGPRSSCLPWYSNRSMRPPRIGCRSRSSPSAEARDAVL